MIEDNHQVIQEWKKQLKEYEKAKRTKKPFGGDFPIVKHVTLREKKLEQLEFHTILQTHKSAKEEHNTSVKENKQRHQSLLNQLKYTQKFEKPYDILNLYPPAAANPRPERTCKEPLRYNYNIVNNQQLEQHYYINKEVKLTNKPDKVIDRPSVRDYDIITNNYATNNQQRRRRQSQQMEKQAQEKYWKTHEFNPLVSAFYDQQKEEKYHKQLEIKQKQHGKDYTLKQPPSYIYRQPLIIDPTKQIPSQVKELEQKTKLAKKRYETKYKLQRQYSNKEIQREQKQLKTIFSRVHEGKILEDQRKKFNIITLDDYDLQYKLSLFPKQANKSMGYSQSSKTLIKSTGFNA